MLISLLALVTAAQADIAPPRVRGGANLSPWDTADAGPGEAADVELDRVAIEATLTPITARIRALYELKSSRASEGQLFGLPAERGTTRFLPRRGLEIRIDGLEVTPRYVESWICAPNPYAQGDFAPHILRDPDAPCGEEIPPDPDAGGLGSLLSSWTGRAYPNHWWVFPIDLPAGQPVEVEVRYAQADTDVYWSGDGFEALFSAHLWSGQWSGDEIASVEIDLTLEGLDDAEITHTSDEFAQRDGTLSWHFEDLPWQVERPDTRDRMRRLIAARDAGDEQAMARIRAEASAVQRDSQRPVHLRMFVPDAVPRDQPLAPYLSSEDAALIGLEDYAARFFLSSEPPTPDDWAALVGALQDAAAGGGEAGAWAGAALGELAGWLEDAALDGPERDRAAAWLDAPDGPAEGRDGPLYALARFPPEFDASALIDASEGARTRRLGLGALAVGSLIGIGALGWRRARAGG